MAYDKVVDSAVLDAGLTAIADAIRAKGGASGNLTFPSDMANAIAAIQTGAETSEHTWDQIPTAVKNFLDNVTYDPGDYSTTQIADYAPATADVNNTYPVGQTVETENGILDRNGYKIAVSSGNTTLYNDIPNQFTEYVNRNNGAVSNVGTLKPTGALRQIKCNTSNVRDLGGWACDGGTVKYGKLFRGGEFQTADLDVFINQLGIRHELNLRGTSEADSEITILRDYVEYTCPEQYVWYTIQDSYKETWKEILRCVFDSVTRNEPVYFHCSAGADRTGTVACILEAILGMSQSDIDKDYELTCFASGVSTDTAARRRNESEWSGLITQINNLSGDTFRDKVIGWIATMGFTADEINAYRAAMIDGTPDAITLNTETYAVTNTLTNVETDNDATTAAQYQPYNAEITVPAGYAIESVKITMGGTDVTAEVFKGNRTNLNSRVTWNLTGCTSGRPSNAAMLGQSYVAFITAEEGYTLNGASVTITMGGIDMAQYYSDGKIAIPNVTGDLVITISAVESAQETLPITWLNGYNCTYSVGSACTVSAADSYIITEEMPVEYGKSYTFADWACPSASAAYKWVGVDTNGIVTETQDTKPGAVMVYTGTWTPTNQSTVGVRIRGYASAADSLTAITELVVS